ncbi:hypothetical protein [Shewanella algae]
MMIHKYLFNIFDEKPKLKPERREDDIANTGKGGKFQHRGLVNTNGFKAFPGCVRHKR